MLIFIDARSSEKGITKLSEYGKAIPFETTGIVDEYISYHPDLFLCKTPDHLITAPNLPASYFSLLDQHKIKYIIGNSSVAKDYPACAAYNSVVNEKFVIHKTSISDRSITELSQIKIDVKQGMTRCSLISLDSENYITSDKGIEKVLRIHKLNVIYVEPCQITLPGKSYGQIGGTVGMNKDTIFFNGSLSSLSEQTELRSFIENAGKKIVELSDDPLFDGGSIFFVK